MNTKKNMNYQEIDINLFHLSESLSDIVNSHTYSKDINNKIIKLINYIDSKIYDDSKFKEYDIIAEHFFLKTLYEKPDFNKN